MNFRFPIWVGGSNGSDGNGQGRQVIAFSSAARAFNYLSAHASGQVKIELISETRFREMLPGLHAQGVVEISFDPDPHGGGAMTIALWAIEKVLAIAESR